MLIIGQNLALSNEKFPLQIKISFKRIKCYWDILLS